MYGGSSKHTGLRDQTNRTPGTNKGRQGERGRVAWSSRVCPSLSSRDETGKKTGEAAIGESTRCRSALSNGAVKLWQFKPVAIDFGVGGG